MKNLKILLVIICIIVVGCDNNYYEKNKNDIKIGAILPLTGDLATYGDEVKKGIDIGLELYKDSVVVLYEDDKGQPRDGVNAINKLMFENVKYIIGAVPSSVTLSIAPVAEKNEIILLSPASSSPDITSAGDYIFRNYPSDVYEGKAMAELAVEKGYKNFISITINNDYGIGLKKVFKKTVEDNNSKVLIQKEFNEGDVNFKPMLVSLNKYLKENDVAFFIVGYGGELGRIIKQARELGINNQFFSTVNFLDNNTKVTGGKSIEGTIFSSPSFDVNDKDTLIVSFVEKYKDKYGKDPTIWSGQGYDAIRILMSVIDKKTKTSEVKNKLYKLSDFPGVTGETSFDNNGDVIKSLTVMTVKNGQFKSLK